jgi:hypothetical protein
VRIVVVFLRSVAVMVSRQCTATGDVHESPHPMRGCRTRPRHPRSGRAMASVYHIRPMK